MHYTRVIAFPCIQWREIHHIEGVTIERLTSTCSRYRGCKNVRDAESPAALCALALLTAALKVSGKDSVGASVVLQVKVIKFYGSGRAVSKTRPLPVGKETWVTVVIELARRTWCKFNGGTNGIRAHAKRDVGGVRLSRFHDLRAKEGITTAGTLIPADDVRYDCFPFDEVIVLLIDGVIDEAIFSAA
jgi:hypothetical protein